MILINDLLFNKNQFHVWRQNVTKLEFDMSAQTLDVVPGNLTTDLPI